MKVMGFLLGHYDSRGGTIFIGGDDEAEAKKLLRRSLHINEDFIDMIWEEDLLGSGCLHFPHDYTPKSGVVDLEEEGRVLVDAAYNGPLNWEEEDEEECLILDLVTAVSKDVLLEFVPRPHQPVTLKGWSHPRWDDDAWGFMLIIP